MSVRPSDHLRSLSNDDISMVVRLWLGLDAFDTSLIFCCSCNKPIAHDPWHRLSCTAEAGTGFKQRHDDIRIVLQNLCKLYGIYGMAEPNIYETSSTSTRPGARPDLLLYGLNNDKIVLDFKVVHPGAPSYVKQAIHPGRVVSNGEDDKRQHHVEKATAAGLAFEPFVVSTFCEFGKAALAVLQRLARHAENISMIIQQSFCADPESVARRFFSAAIELTSIACLRGSVSSIYYGGALPPAHTRYVNKSTARAAARRFQR